MKKYIFFDLDGTLIDNQTGEVPKSTLVLLQKLKEQGHELFIATGRPPSLFYGIDKKLGFDSFIASNGALVVYKGDVIYNNPLDIQVIKEFVFFAKENSLDVGFETFEEYFVESKITPYVEKFSELYHLHIPEVKPGYYQTQDIYQMLLFYKDDDYDKFNKLFPSLRFIYSNAYGLDVNRKEGLKELGLQEVQRLLNINKEDMIAVGDGYNDIGMIQYAGIGIAVGNAKDALKEAADYVSKPIAEDGLYEIFKELGIIT